MQETFWIERQPPQTRTDSLLASVPAVVERMLEDNPTLARPRSLAERNHFQGRIMRQIATAHNLDLMAIAHRVASAYGAIVPHT